MTFPTLATFTGLAVGFGPRVTLASSFEPHSPLSYGSPVPGKPEFNGWLCSHENSVAQPILIGKEGGGNCDWLCWLIVVGCWLLVVGCWLLVVG